MPWVNQISEFLIQVLEPVKVRKANSLALIIENLTLVVVSVIQLILSVIRLIRIFITLLFVSVIQLILSAIREARNFAKVFKNLLFTTIACSIIISNFCISNYLCLSPIWLSIIGLAIGLIQSFIFDGKATYFFNLFLGPFVALLTPHLFLPFYRSLLQFIADFSMHHLG